MADGVVTSTIETFATGIRIGESPRWHDGRFWMCGRLVGEVLVFDPSGTRHTAARVDGLPFSVDWLPDGRLLSTTDKGVRVEPDLTPYGAGDRPWNEIVVDAAGRAYINMPGSMSHEESRPGVVMPDRHSRIAADDVWFPTGMAVTPDGTTLILAESHVHRLTAFTISDGDLVDRRVLADSLRVRRLPIG